MTVVQIRNALEKIASDLGLRDPKIQAEQSGKWVHVLISSQDFSGQSPGDRDNMIWRELEKRFDDETILSITQCYLLTPKEYRESAMVGS